MNLADAIRRAAHASGAPLGQPEPRAQAPETSATDYESAPPAPKVAAKESTMNNGPEKQIPEHSGEHAPAPEYGNIVRLELVLTPEQLKGLFGAVVANQHSVMTLREAANYLRVSTGALEQLAQEGEVPGMTVDGKWRFTRQGLDDWLNTHSHRKEA